MVKKTETKTKTLTQALSTRCYTVPRKLELLFGAGGIFIINKYVMITLTRILTTQAQYFTKLVVLEYTFF